MFLPCGGCRRGVFFLWKGHHPGNAGAGIPRRPHLGRSRPFATWGQKAAFSPTRALFENGRALEPLG